MLVFVISVVTLCVTNICQASPRDRTDISEILNYLRAKVDSLDAKLDILLERSGEQNSGNKPGDVEIISKPGQLISAQRVPLDGGERNRFVIRLRNTSDEEITARIYGDGDERAPDSIEAEGDGIYAITVDVTGHGKDSYFFQIMDKEYDHVFTLYLRNTPSSAMIQRLENENVPLLNIHPEKEVVYTPGQNVTLTASLHFHEVSLKLEDTSTSMLSTSFSGIDLTSGDNEFLWSRHGFFDTYVHPRTKGKFEISHTIDTASRSLGGYMSVSALNNTIEGTVVTAIQVMRSVTIRPFNQSGPFPPGYLQVVSHDKETRSTRGNELRTCKFGKECWIDCYAIGEHVTSVQVKKVMPGGNMCFVPSARSPPQLINTMQSVHWKFEANAEAASGEGITTFMCSAHNADTGQVATKLFDVQVTRSGTIEIEASSAVVEVDPTNSNIRKISLNCAVFGQPLPDVYFYPAIDQASFPLLQAPDQVLQSDPYRAIAKKEYTMSAEEFGQLQQDINSGNYTPYSCQIFTYEISEDVVASYTFQLPDTA